MSSMLKPEEILFLVLFFRQKTASVTDIFEIIAILLDSIGLFWILLHFIGSSWISLNFNVSH